MKFISPILMSIISVFAPAKAVLLTTLLLVLVDMVTGAIAAKKRGEKITSAGFGRTIAKILVYELAVGLGFLTETYMTGPMVPVSKIVSSLIGLTELKSCIENLNDINGSPVLTSLVQKLSSQNASRE